MSSLLRLYSQIPVREKFLLVAGTPVTSGVPSAVSGFTLTAGEHINLSSISTNADIAVASGYTIYQGLVAGDLYKDMGRQITIFDPATHNHLAVFRQVQAVKGADTEGVDVEGTVPESYYANIYLKVWSADGAGVVVVRTG